MLPKSLDRSRPCPRCIIGALVFTIALGLSPATYSQSATQQRPSKTESSFNPRDLSGLWFGGVGGGLRVQGKVAPMTREGQARFDANTAELKKDSTISADPTFRCEP